MKLKFFLSGIMKGDLIGSGLYDQSYRTQLVSSIRKTYPNSDILGFEELYPEGTNGIEQKAYFELVKQASDCDIIIAFLPKPSMGTAIEIWEGYKKGKVILTISPLKKNWTVRFISSYIFNNIIELEAFLKEDKLTELIRNRKAYDKN